MRLRTPLLVSSLCAAAAVGGAALVPEAASPQSGSVAVRTKSGDAEAVPCGKKRTAYVIASEERFNDGRVQELREWLGDDVNFIRASPMIASDDKRTRGIAVAHKNVWAAISLREDQQRALVFESDFEWRGAGMTKEWLRGAMEDVWARTDEDVTNIGWCDVCHGTKDHPCVSCATAYAIHPRLATAMVADDRGYGGPTPFMAADTALVGVCDNHHSYEDTLGWVGDLQHRVGMQANCSYIPYPNRTAPSFFRSIFVQAVDRFGGAHNGRRTAPGEEGV